MAYLLFLFGGVLPSKKKGSNREKKECQTRSQSSPFESRKAECLRKMGKVFESLFSLAKKKKERGEPLTMGKGKRGRGVGGPV